MILINTTEHVYINWLISITSVHKNGIHHLDYNLKLNTLKNQDT